MSEEQWTLELALKRVLAHEATIAQQQARIEALERERDDYKQAHASLAAATPTAWAYEQVCKARDMWESRAKEGQQALAAERKRAGKADVDAAYYLGQLQAEREKSAPALAARDRAERVVEDMAGKLVRLEALAGLATEMREAIEPLGDDAAFTPADPKWWVAWCARYDLITQAPEAGQ